MQYLFIRETWSHMGKSSGFDPLFDSLGKLCGANTVSVYANQFEKSPSKGRWQRYFKKPVAVSIANRISPFIELRHERLAQHVVAQMKLNPDALVFMSVAENQFAPSFNSLNEHELSRLVLFVHQPPAWFKLNWSDTTVFSKVKAIVCLSSKQRDYFQTLSGTTLVLQIHHGVDLSFFTPTGHTEFNGGKFLFVGQWLRDLTVLSESFLLIQKKYPEVSLHCVIQRRFRNNPALYKLAQSDAVFWYDDISSEQLLHLYQSSDALYLPLIDSTANNALNEALACGLPVITSNVGGTDDYIYTSATILATPFDAMDFARAGMEFIQNASVYTGLKYQIRKHAETYLSWDHQAKIILSQLNLLHESR